MVNEIISVVIPALNPNAEFPDYCRALVDSFKGQIVLVDDGSDKEHQSLFDRCQALSPNIVVLHHDVNRGKGRALKTAFAWLLENQPKILGCVTADSDGQHAVQDVMRCVQELSDNPDSLVLGCRDFSGSNVPWKSSFGNNWMRVLFLLVSGHNFWDTQTGLRGISREFMQKLISVRGERFEFETKMLLCTYGVPIKQYSIQTVYEDGNKGTHFNPIVDSLKVLKVIASVGVLRMVLFVCSSILSFGVDIVLFYLLYNFAFNDGTSFRLGLSVLLARVVSMIVNYLLNEGMVFKQRFLDKGVKEEAKKFGRYLSLASCVLFASYCVTKVFTLLFPESPVVELKIFADLILFIIGYVVQRIKIFVK